MTTPVKPRHQYLTGHPGTGKSARLSERLIELVKGGTRPDRILVLASQQSQADRFRQALAKSGVAARGEPTITTLSGLVQEHIGLYFPLIAGKAGFDDPGREPLFINVEATQFLLDQFVAPHVAAFSELRVARPRLVSQILDDLNRAATSGFGLDELAERLHLAWHGVEPRLHLYQQAQAIAQGFRVFCLERGLLDYSLTMHVYGAHMLQAKFYQDYVAARYRHVLVDNIEEGVPVLHDFLALVLKTCDSALFIEDDPGSYRLFLGADRNTARRLREQCDSVVDVPDPRLAPEAPPSPARFGDALMRSVRKTDRYRPLRVTPRSADGAASAGVEVLTEPSTTDYWTTMVQVVVDRIVRLVADGAEPKDISIVAPIVEDVLRFELEERLRQHGIGVRALRPSRPLHDHPIARTLLTLAKLAHPDWTLPVSSGELARALAVTIADLDIVRAQLIADAAQRITPKTLSPIEDPALWTRVGMPFRVPYDRLQHWLADVIQGDVRPPLDVFWQRLFSELLSQPGFGLHKHAEGAVLSERLINATRQFGQAFKRADLAHAQLLAAAPVGPAPASPMSADIQTQDAGLAYVSLLMQGMLAAQYMDMRDQAGAGASDDVFLSPAFAYLTSDHFSRFEFWLDTNNHAWHERLYQPLTHPYVLRRDWSRSAPWTDEDDFASDCDLLARVVGGLAMRASERVFLAGSRLNVAGAEEDGLLARALPHALSLPSPMSPTSSQAA